MGKNFRETLNEQMKDPEFRAEWEALAPMREIGKAIINGKPLTGYTVEQIADAAGVSLEEARIMQKGRQAHVTRAGKHQARVAAH